MSDVSRLAPSLGLLGYLAGRSPLTPFQGSRDPGEISGPVSISRGPIQIDPTLGSGTPANVAKSHTDVLYCPSAYRAATLYRAAWGGVRGALKWLSV